MIERPLHPREYLLVPIALALGAFLVYDVPFFGLPLSAVVLGRLVFAGADALAIATIAGAGLASVLFGVTRPLMVVPALGALIWGARALSKRQTWQVFVIVTLVAYFAYMAAFSAGAILQGTSPVDAVIVQVDQALEQMDAVFAGPRTDSVVRSSYGDLRDTTRVGLLAIWPGVNLVGMMLAVALSLLWLSRLAIAHGILPRGPRPLVAFDVSWHLAWPLIAGLGLTAWALYTDSEATLLAGLGFNLLLVAGSVVCVQGFAVTEAALRRFRLGILLRLLAYGALFWTNLLLPLFAVAGTADLWANFRKIPRGPKPPTPITESASDGGVE